MFTAILRPVIKKVYPEPKNAKSKEDVARHRRFARIHAQNRAWERYGVNLSGKALRRCEKSIYAKTSELVGRIGRRQYGNYRELHIIKHMSRKTHKVTNLYAVYDYQLKCIVTFVPGLKNWPGQYV